MDLVAYINELNRRGVEIYRCLSPQLLISLMQTASRESSDFHKSLDPFAEAKFAVSWAGEEKSANWFDTAREVTERWHHQQQIRMAVKRPGIMTPELYHPVLDCFMRALPFTYRTIHSKSGSLVQFHVTGNCGGRWFLYRNDSSWHLVTSATGDLVAETTIPQEIAWRIFTKGIGAEAAKQQVTVEGDKRVGLHILSMITIVG